MTLYTQALQASRRYTRFVLAICLVGMMAAYLGLFVLRAGVAEISQDRWWLIVASPAIAYGLLAGCLLSLPAVLIRLTRRST